MSVLVKYETPDLPAVGFGKRSSEMLVIENQAGYDNATDLAKFLKSTLDQIEAKRKTIVDPINAAKDAVQALFKPSLDEYKTAVATVKGKMVAYVLEQERIARERQAEADRIAREAQERALAEAKALEAMKLPEAAADLREAASMIVAPTVQVGVTKGAGDSMRKKWTCEVSDWCALVDFIAANPDFLSLLTFNKSAADKMAQAMKGALRVPGIKVTETRVASISTL